MYKSFYNLNFDPFQSQAESPFFWKNDRHDTIIARLKRGVLEQRGFFLLTGEKGVGKTHLVDRLLELVNDRTDNSYLPVKSQNPVAFYNQVLSGFGLEADVTAKIQFYIQITNHLQNVQKSNRIGLLVVDNAHLLSQELLDELRHISNIEHEGVKLVNIMLVGDVELIELLERQQNRAIRQNLLTPVSLGSLAENEVKQYVKFRLHVAGGGPKIFTEKGMLSVNRYSQGVIRRINNLCEAALILGHKKNKRHIGEHEVAEAAVELNLVVQDKNPGTKNEKKLRKVQGAGRGKKIIKDLSRKVENSQQYVEKTSSTKVPWLLTVLISSLISIAALFYLVPELFQSPLGEQGDVRLKDVMGVESALLPSKDPVREDEKLLSSVHNEQKKNVEGIIVSDPDTEDTQDKTDIEAVAEPSGKETGSDVTEPSIDLVKADLEKEEVAEPVGEQTKNEVVEQPVVISKKEMKSFPAQKTIETETKNDLAQKEHEQQEKQVEQQKQLAENSTSTQEHRPVLLEGTMILETRPNSSQVTNEALAELRKFAERLLLYPEATIQVEGYIASKNNSKENIQLSAKRANIVKEYLIDQGVASDQILVKGMGNQNPRGSNDTREGRKKNRRVEIFVIDDAR